MTAASPSSSSSSSSSPPPSDGGAPRLMMLSAAYASLGTASVLAIVKAAAWQGTGSSSILAALIDSLFDMAAAGITLFAVRVALAPADREHRFGHGKAEALAGYTQGLIILAAALAAAATAIDRLIDPRPLTASFFGVAALLISMILSVALIAYQNHVTRRTGSPAIKADAAHYKSDLALNGGALVGFGVAAFGAAPRIDAAMALALVGLIVYNAIDLLREMVDQLMDREIGDEDRERIRGVIAAHPDVHNLHDLRTRRAGRRIIIQMHLEMAGKISLHQAHAISDSVEEELMRIFPQAEIFVHQDPSGVESFTELESEDRLTPEEARRLRRRADEEKKQGDGA